VLHRRPEYVATQEVLAGVGLGDRLELRLRGGRRVRVEPGLAAAREVLDPAVEPRALTELDGARVLLVSYNVTRGDTKAFAVEVEQRSRRAERIVLDLRRNGGGDNRTYRPLLRALERGCDRGAGLAVLIGRATFSAAMQLLVDLERRTPAVFVGEPTGGSPNHNGDGEPVRLPESGLTARVATRAWCTAGPGDERLTKEPDVAVELDSAGYFGEGDPTLESALSTKAIARG
jgi:hypothetical protein